MQSIRPRLLSSSLTATTITRTLVVPLSARLNFKRMASATAPTAADRVSDVVFRDHRELEEYYDKILRATDHDTKTRWQNQFTWELARHSIAEELVTYPAFEKNLGDHGKAMAEKDRGEHQAVSVIAAFTSLSSVSLQLFPKLTNREFLTSNSLPRPQVKEQLKVFQKMKSTDPSFEPTLKNLMADLAKHIKEEESDDFPALEKALTVEDSAELASSFERTKMFVPSRSHPHAPNRPPFETLAGLLAAPMDRLGDMLRKFPRDKDEV